MIVIMEGDKLVCAREFPVQVMFREQVVGKFALDLVVENTVIVELKALETLTAVHTQQMVAYLTASGLPVGLLINFGAAQLQYKRIFPPKSVQRATAFQLRQK